MKQIPQHAQDSIAARVLAFTESRVGQSECDLSACEDAALFLDGAMTEAEGEAFLAKLDADPALRQAVSNDLRPADVQLAHRSAATRTRQALLLALAASLLFTATFLGRPAQNNSVVAEAELHRQASEWLRDSEFEKVKSAISDAEPRGITSPRLANLRAQAVAEVPREVSLLGAGALYEFGFAVDGTTAREPTEPLSITRLEAAYDLHAGIESPDGVHALNRGYLLLRMHRSEAAMQTFSKITQSQSESALGWLGHGLAAYGLGEFDVAINSFRQAVGVDAGLVAAHINLAMALTESGDYQGALDEWMSVATLDSEIGSREDVQNEIAELRSFLSDRD